MTLSDIPPEILLEIADYLPCSTLGALVSTNRHFHSSLNDHLYWYDARGEYSAALMFAAKEGIVETAQKALRANANTELGNQGTRPLDEAVRGHHTALAQLLLEAGANAELDARVDCLGFGCRHDSHEGRCNSLLHVATEAKFLDMMEVLLKHGVTVDSSNYWGHTPLLLAIKNSNTAAVKLLLSHGANVDLRTVSKAGVHKTPLICAAFTSRAVFKLLLDYGANVNEGDGLLYNPLSSAVRWDKREIVDLILESDIDIHHKGGVHIATGRTALWVAIIEHRWDLFLLLLENGADPTPVGPRDCMPPLWKAAHLTFFENYRERAADMVRVLLDYGCDPNATKGNHPTPLAMAVRAQHLASVKMLLEKGADPNSNRLPHNIRCPLLRFNPLARAVKLRNRAMAQMLIEDGADPNVRGWKGQNMFLKSVQLKLPLHCIEKMLQMGANPNATSPFGDTALFLATMAGNEHLTKILLNYGADPNTTKKSISMLSWAIRKQQCGVAKIICEYGGEEFAA